jgi:hypothetical protein
MTDITSWADLADMNSDLTDDYVLTVDLDQNSAGYDTYASSSANSGEGWIPIGDNSTNFTGTFDGGGHTISDIFISRSADYQGLFGSSTGCSISDLGVLNVDITGDEYVGGLCGYILVSSTISNCYTSGDVAGVSYIGGLIGIASGSVVSNCYSNADATKTVNYASGLISIILDNSTIQYSYSTGFISGGVGTRGGLIALNSTSTITSCFYDTTTSGQSDTGNGVPKTTTQMEDITTFSAWDIVAIGSYVDENWFIDDGNDYPRLGIEYVPTPDTIDADAYLIKTSSDTIDADASLIRYNPIWTELESQRTNDFSNYVPKLIGIKNMPNNRVIATNMCDALADDGYVRYMNYSDMSSVSTIKSLNFTEIDTTNFHSNGGYIEDTSGNVYSFHNNGVSVYYNKYSNITDSGMTVGSKIATNISTTYDTVNSKDGSKYFDIIPLQTDKWFVSYMDDDLDLRYAICTASGGSLTFTGRTEINGSTNCYGVRAEKIDDTHVIYFYIDLYSEVQARIGTLSGTTMTFGAEFTVATGRNRIQGIETFINGDNYSVVSRDSSTGTVRVETVAVDGSYVITSDSSQILSLTTSTETDGDVYIHHSTQKHNGFFLSIRHNNGIHNSFHSIGGDGQLTEIHEETTMPNINDFLAVGKFYDWIDETTLLMVYNGDIGDQYNFRTIQLFEESTVNTYSKTVDADAELFKKFSDDVDGDASLWKQSSDDVTGESFLVKTLSDTVEGDASLWKQSSDTIDADASLDKQSLDTIDADASLWKQPSDVISGDASLWKQPSYIITGDAEIYKSPTNVISGDAFLWKQPSYTVDGDAYLDKQYFDTVDGDASLWKQPSDVISGDAVLFKQFSDVVSGDSYLDKKYFDTIQGDAYIHEEMDGEIFANAYLYKRFSDNVSGESYLYKRYSDTITSDAELYKALGVNIQGDAVVFKTFLDTVDSDSYLYKRYSDTITSDAVLYKALGVNIQGDAVVFKQLINNIGGDALLSKQISNNIFANSYLYKRYSDDISGDAILFKQFSDDVTGESFIIKTSSFDIDASAYLEKLLLIKPSIKLVEYFKAKGSSRIFVPSGMGSSFKPTLVVN